MEYGKGRQRGYKNCIPHWIASSKPAGETSKESLLSLQPCFPKPADIFLQLAYWGQGECCAGSGGCIYGHTPDPPGYRWAQGSMVGRESVEVKKKDEFIVAVLSSGLALYLAHTCTKMHTNKERDAILFVVEAL